MRFIPARAGNTRGLAPKAPRPPVHPRSRGEHHLQQVVMPRVNGSSPLARGTRPDLRRDLPAGRFIPARAGNTTRITGRSMYSPVHPRSRGEHAVPVPVGLAPFGSSPLARGTLPRLWRQRHPDRFIPARAGNTSTRARAIVSAAVHPRSRGEHSQHETLDDGSYGSSPLARGTPHLPAARLHQRRFIPARAGNTTAPARSADPGTVHPRSRGEHPW